MSEINPQSANPFAFVCTIISVIAASITIAQVQALVTIGAGIIAMASGTMAIRYYFYATKEKIKSQER